MVRLTSTALTAALLVTLTGCGGGTPERAPSPVPTSSAATAETPAAPTPTTAPPTTAPAPAAQKHRFPVDGKASWSRTHSGYHATDIFAACGLPVRAVLDGVVLEVNRVDTFDKARPRGAEKGGLSVSLLGDDGVRYYGSHLTTIASGIDAGVRVRAGDQLGTVGRTGNASNVCHLHFGISPPCARTADWWVRRGVVYPWRYLDAWRAGTALSPVAEVQAWQKANGCPTKPPANEQ